jgi:hypothetical protein
MSSSLLMSAALGAVPRMLSPELVWLFDPLVVERELPDFERELPDFEPELRELDALAPFPVLRPSAIPKNTIQS